MISTLDIFICFAYFALPVIFLVRLWKNHSTNLGKWLLDVSVCGIFVWNIFFVGIWPMTFVAFWRYPLIACFLVTVLKSARNEKRKFKFTKVSYRYISLYACGLFLSGFFLWEILSAIHGSYCPPNAVDLDFPLKEGKFCVVHGGSNKSINYHCCVEAQKFALDIVQVNNFGLRLKNWRKKKLDDFIVYGSTVYSPCDGTVIEAVDCHDDLEPSIMDSQNPAGNYIAIAISDSEVVVLLAHLKENSLQIKEGDIVEKGQPLAQVGNTGNTTEPHLHIHCVSGTSKEFLFSGVPIPMKFNNRFLIRNSTL